jgi:hypothetical protein
VIPKVKQRFCSSRGSAQEHDTLLGRHAHESMQVALDLDAVVGGSALLEELIQEGGEV